MTNINKITNVSFSGFKSKTIAERRKIRNAYQRQYRAKKKQEFLKEQRDLKSLEKQITNRIKQLDKIQKGVGANLSKDYFSYKSDKMNTTEIKRDKRKEYGQRKNTLDVYNDLFKHGKDLLNKWNNSPLVVENRKTAQAASLSGVKTRRSKKGRVIPILSGLSRSTINKYRRNRRRIANGKINDISDVIEEFKRRVGSDINQYSSDQIVSAAADVMDDPTFNDSDEIDRNELYDKYIDSEYSNINITGRYW